MNRFCELLVSKSTEDNANALVNKNECIPRTPSRILSVSFVSPAERIGPFYPALLPTALSSHELANFTPEYVIV